MPGCIFKVYGEYFDVDAYLAVCTRWQPGSVFHKGTVRFIKKKTLHSSSGFNFAVTENEDFRVQMREAYTFINTYSEELNTLANIDGQEPEKCLSFSKLYQEYTFPYAYFPVALVREAAKFGISLDVGMFHYPNGEGRIEKKLD